MRTRNEKNRLIEELKELPVISIVCKRTGIGKSNYYRWMGKDMDFNEKVYHAIKVGRENINDIAEGHLIAAMRRGEKWAIQYILENNSIRYYKPKRVQDTIDAPYQGVTEITIIKNAENKIDEINKS